MKFYELDRDAQTFRGYVSFLKRGAHKLYEYPAGIPISPVNVAMVLEGVTGDHLREIPGITPRQKSLEKEA